mgnify:CR=1 FL=1
MLPPGTALLYLREVRSSNVLALSHWPSSFSLPACSAISSGVMMSPMLTCISVSHFRHDDPAKKAVSMAGIREVMKQVRSGHPVGFFPAGAISKINRHGWLEDQEWKPVVMRLIAQLKVPVIPVFFHGTNSFMFNLLGRVSWVLRTMRLPSDGCSP